MAYHITIICVFLWIPENVTLCDTFSYMHSMLSIDFIDASTSSNTHLLICTNGANGELAVV